MKSSVQIVNGDITKIQADAIVNSANPFPICGGSTEACIYEAAGYDELLEARQKIGFLEVCDAESTDAFNLDAKYLIHVSAPRWNDGRSGEIVALKICYQNAMRKARDLGCKSIAFPLLSSGVYRFPKDLALEIAKDSIIEFLQGEGDRCDITASIVLYDDESIRISEDLFGQIQNYIYENYVPEEPEENFSPIHMECAMEGSYNLANLAIVSPRIKDRSDFDKSIKELFDDPNNLVSFSEKMCEWMNRKNISAPELQKDGNIDRKHFSKILGKKINPSKEAAIAIAIGLKLSYIEAVELLALAGWALSPASKTDLIVKFFMENKDMFYRENPICNKYKVTELNDRLMDHGENTLGAGRDLKPLK